MDFRPVRYLPSEYVEEEIDLVQAVKELREIQKATRESERIFYAHLKKIIPDLDIGHKR